MLGTFFTLQRYQVKSFNMYCINHNSFWFFSKKEKRKKASQSEEKMGKLSCQCWIVLISFLSQVLLMERKWWNKVVKALHLQSTPQALRSTPPKKLPHWASFTTLQSRSGPPSKPRWEVNPSELQSRSWDWMKRKLPFAPHLHVGGISLSALMLTLGVGASRMVRTGQRL